MTTAAALGRAAKALAGSLVLLASLAALAQPAVAQCAMCRTALESPEGALLAWSFRRAILFLLAAPFVTVGVIALLVTRESRQRAARTPPD